MFRKVITYVSYLLNLYGINNSSTIYNKVKTSLDIVNWEGEALFLCHFIKKTAKKFVVSKKMCNFAVLNIKTSTNMKIQNNNTWWWRNSRLI